VMDRRIALLVKDEKTGELVPLRLYNGQLVVSFVEERITIETRDKHARIPADDNSAVILGADSRRKENILPLEADKDGALKLIIKGTLLGLSSFANHHARHENGGADDISVEGLSGELADNQPALQHALNSAVRHTMTATVNRVFTADANGLPKDSGVEPADLRNTNSDALALAFFLQGAA